MIGPSLTSSLRNLRAQARSTMVDTCTIARLTTYWDEERQETVTDFLPIHENVPCTIDMPPVTTRTLVTDETVTPGQPLVKIPVTYLGIEPDDRVQITAISPTSDPEMLGAFMWVTHNRSRSTAVSRRLECRWIK